MKTIIYKVMLIMLLVPSLLLANNENKWKHTEEKTYNKEFSVNADATLKVKNTFGNVAIESWNQNKIKIDVLITVSGNDLEKVKEQLKKISVNFTNTSSLVEAITKIEKGKNRWSWKKGNNISFKINYTIKVPKSNLLDIANDYGNIELDATDGQAMINCDYGKIVIGKLNASNNKINIDYCSNSTIEYMNGGNINADYSGITVNKAGNVILNADYNTSSFGTVNKLDYNCDYGSLKVDSAGVINGSGDYLSMKIEALEKEMKVDASYGSLKVNDLKNSVKNVNVNSSYGSVSLKYGSGYNFNFDIKTGYGGISVSDDATLTTKEKKTNSKHYSGYVGSASSGNTIYVKSSYGGVSIKQQ